MKRFKNRLGRGQLGLEQLEARQCMAGDVHAFLDHGILRINEAQGHVGGAQSVLVTNESNGVIRVTGTTSPANPTGSRVNNGDFVKFGGVNRIEVNLGHGSDSIKFQGTNGPFKITDMIVNTTIPGNTTNDADSVTLLNVKVFNALEITTGGGQDRVSISNSTVVVTPATQGNRFTINTGGGGINLDDQDVVDIVNVTTAVGLSVKTGAAHDSVNMRNTSIGTTGQHQLWFDLGSGGDSLLLGSSQSQYLPVTASAGIRVDAGTDSEFDVDHVVMNDVFAKESFYMVMGAGDDVVEMNNVQSRKSFELNGMKGNDLFDLKGVEAFENFFAKMGEGSDILDITYLRARKADLDGGTGTGYDRLLFTQSPNIPTLIRTNFEEINGQKPPVKKTGSK